MTQSTNQHSVLVACDGEFTKEAFKDYVAISDYMSKQKKFKRLLIALFIYGILIIPILWIIGFPNIIIAIIAIFIYTYLLAFAIAIIRKKPVWWGTRYQTNQLIKLYSESLGYSPNNVQRKFHFEVSNDAARFKTATKEFSIPLNSIYWIREIDDLVIIGFLNGAKSYVNPLFSNEIQHYKAVPAAAFLKSKLEGMDPDELIALLEEYAKKPKPPLSRKGNSR